jgi:hypothetical protein
MSASTGKGRCGITRASAVVLQRMVVPLLCWLDVYGLRRTCRAMARLNRPFVREMQARLDARGLHGVNFLRAARRGHFELHGPIVLEAILGQNWAASILDTGVALVGRSAPRAPAGEAADATETRLGEATVEAQWAFHCVAMFGTRRVVPKSELYLDHNPSPPRRSMWTEMIRQSIGPPWRHRRSDWGEWAELATIYDRHLRHSMASRTIWHDGVCVQDRSREPAWRGDSGTAVTFAWPDLGLKPSEKLWIRRFTTPSVTAAAGGLRFGFGARGRPFLCIRDLDRLTARVVDLTASPMHMWFTDEPHSHWRRMVVAFARAGFAVVAPRSAVGRRTNMPAGFGERGGVCSDRALGFVGGRDVIAEYLDGRTSRESLLGRIHSCAESGGRHCIGCAGTTASCCMRCDPPKIVGQPRVHHCDNCHGPAASACAHCAAAGVATEPTWEPIDSLSHPNVGPAAQR